MSINCDVILQEGATPDQLKALGAALWRWSTGTAGNTAMYQFLDNQALADLIAGQFPESSAGEPRAFHLRACDEVSPNRQAAIESLRRQIPAQVVVDILVDGASWKVIPLRTPSPVPRLAS